MIRILLGGLYLCMATVAMADCGPAAGPCKIEMGEYHVRTVPQPEAPAVIFLHGAGSNGAAVMKNTGLVDRLTARGYAVIAPTGDRSFGENGASWNFFPGWSGRDETEFLDAVANDAAERFDLNRKQILLAGFSAGAFEVSYLACLSPQTFAAYAPLSGGFWRPQPESCVSPVRLFQSHGWRDAVVPLEGRTLRAGQYIQGDIFAGLALWRTTNECDDQDPSSFQETNGFMRRKWTDCAENAALEFALFPGGHMIPPGWSDMVLDWFEALPTE